MTAKVFVNGGSPGVDLPSAILQADSTDRGALFPRMTTTERDAIPVSASYVGMLVVNTTTTTIDMYTGAAWVSIASSGGGAPADAKYITQTPNSGLSAEQALSLLATGLMQVTTSTGVVSSVTTSAGLAALISDETGTGALVFGTAPTITTSLAINGDAHSAPILTITNTDATGAPGNISTQRSSRNGAALQTNDRIGGLVVNGYGTTGYGGVVGNFTFLAAENFTDSAQGTYFFIGLTAIGGTGTSEVMRLLGAGNMLLGTTVASPLNFLALGGNSARSVGMERHTTSNTAGNSLTLLSGGATSGATNKAAGNLILTTGISTGNAVPPYIQLRAGVTGGGSGSTDRSIVDRTITGATKILTNNSAISLVNATIASNTAVGGMLIYLVEVSDGTDLQSESGMAVYTAVNKAGTITSSITEVSSQQDRSSGTLATTWAISAANPAVISLNANSSLTPGTAYPRVTYTIFNHGQQAITIL